MNLEIERKINIADVPKEFRMAVLKYRGLIKASLYFMECFAEETTIQNAKRLEKSIDKTIGAENIIKLLFDVPGFCLPSNIIQEQQDFKEKISHLQ